MKTKTDNNAGLPLNGASAAGRDIPALIGRIIVIGALVASVAAVRVNARELPKLAIEPSPALHETVVDVHGLFSDVNGLFSDVHGSSRNSTRDPALKGHTALLETGCLEPAGASAAATATTGGHHHG
jgi:hypothetical protein